MLPWKILRTGSDLCKLHALAIRSTASVWSSSPAVPWLQRQFASTPERKRLYNNAPLDRQFVPTPVPKTYGDLEKQEVVSRLLAPAVPSREEVLRRCEPEAPLLLEKSSNELLADDVGGFYSLQTSLVPEALKPFHQSFYAPREWVHQERTGGCLGMQKEADASRRHAVMFRKCIYDLMRAIDDPRGPRQILMDAPTMSGKSIALLALAEWARASGWMVLYVPSASALTEGGYFVRRATEPLYDTVISAQHMLKSMVDTHRDRLAALPRTLGDASGTLLELAVGGLAATETEGQLAVESVLALVEELLAASKAQTVRFLICIDDYNLLYSRTDYGETMDPVPGQKDRNAEKVDRRELRVEELALARGVRLLNRADISSTGAVVVGATTWSRVFSTPRTRIPLVKDASKFYVPRYDLVETAHMLAHYADCKWAPYMPSLSQVKKMQQLTCGNGTEVRKLAPKLSMLDVNLRHALF